MKKIVDKQNLGLFVILTSVVVCLLVSPMNSIDPINLPKFFVLTILGFLIGGLVISRLEFLTAKKNRVVVILITLFMLQLFIVALIDKRDFASSLYGASGRNTGILTYLALLFLLLGACISASGLLLLRTSVILLFTGCIVGIYGIFQFFGLDFYDFNNLYGSNVFGPFGNPNFQSSFMGMIGAVSITWATLSNIKIRLKLLLLGLAGLSIFNISQSSSQGFFTLIVGVAFAFIVFFYTSGRVLVACGFFGLTLVAGSLVFLGISNKGPIVEIIYKSSLQARNFYWQAALKMMYEHPLTGVGMDGFGDWYRRSRTQEVASFNPGISADSAHNIALDIGSGGGVPLLLLYLALIALAVISIARVMRRAQGFDPAFASIVGAWFAYQAQTVISINQIGLGVWGWSLTGLLIGYELNTRESKESGFGNKDSRVKVKKRQVSALVVVSTCVLGGVGVATSLPAYLASAKFYEAMQSGDTQRVQSAAYLQPNDRNRYRYAAQIMLVSNLEDQAISLLRDATNIYPDSFELWQTWAGIASASRSDVARAKAQMKRLDPYNPDL